MIRLQFWKKEEDEVTLLAGREEEGILEERFEREPPSLHQLCLYILSCELDCVIECHLIFACNSAFHSFIFRFCVLIVIHSVSQLYLHCGAFC